MGAEKPTLYFPTKVGTKRVVEHTQDEVVEVVSAVEEKAGAKVVSVDWLLDGKKLGCEKLSVTTGGILRLEANGVAFDPPYFELKAGIKSGDRWDIDYTRTVFRFRASYTACDPEEVVVTAGRYLCVTVRMEHHDRNGDLTTVAWYAPGVGLVKEVVKTEAGECVSKVLKSFTPGTD
jgi:hypothetical protein